MCELYGNEEYNKEGLVEINYVSNGVSLRWDIMDPSTYSLEFYETLLSNMKNNIKYERGEGGNSRSSIEYKDNKLVIHAQVGGSGGDQNVFLTLNRDDAIELVELILTRYKEACEKFESTM